MIISLLGFIGAGMANVLTLPLAGAAGLLLIHVIIAIAIASIAFIMAGILESYGLIKACNIIGGGIGATIMGSVLLGMVTGGPLALLLAGAILWSL